MVLLVAAFAAGWIARGRPRGGDAAEQAADPRAAVDEAARRLEAAVDAWLDGSSGGPAALDALDDALAGLVAAERSAPAADRPALADARRALARARALAEGCAEGRPLDVATSRRLTACEDAVGEAARRLGAAS